MKHQVALWTNGGMIVDDEFVWMVPYSCNLLAQYSLKERCVKSYQVFDDFDSNIGGSYFVVQHDDSKFIIPARDSKVKKISPTWEVTNYPIAEMNPNREKYGHVTSVGKKLVMFPLEEKQLLIYENGELEGYPLPINCVIRCIAIGEELYFVNRTSRIWKFDLNNKKLDSIELEGHRICWFEVYGEDLIVSTEEGTVYLLPEKNPKRCRTLATAKEGMYYLPLVLINDTLVMFSNQGEEISYYHLQTTESGTFPIEKSWKKPGWKYNPFGVPIVYNNQIYVSSPSCQALFICNEKGEVVEKHDILLEINREVNHRIYRNQYKNNAYIIEQDPYSIDGFVSYMIDQSERKESVW